MKLSDYFKAIQTAASRKPHRLPLGACSVLRAKLGFQIGPRYHSLYGLADKPATKWPEHIDEDRANWVLVHLSPREQHLALRDKLAFTAQCQRKKLPVAPILFRHDQVADVEIDAMIPNVRTAGQLEAQLRTAPDTLFAKLIDGAHGAGAFRATRIDAGLWRFGSEQGKPADFLAYLERSLGPDERGWLFQPLVRPHSQLAGIMAPGALGTLRILSYLDEADEVHLALPTLRIPAGRSQTDNFSLGSSGNLVAAVDMDTGRLQPAAFSRTPHWPEIRRTDVHPDSGARITGFALPYWSETCELVKHAQTLIGNPPTIGWDIAITESGPLIIEANSAYGTAIHEVALDRGIRTDFERIVNTVRARRAREHQTSSLA